uniref:Uncharacterized protein n=1 Tax=Arundo donax TaxID=35708 RepID=A0A0A8ZLC8_ARUDO
MSKLEFWTCSRMYNKAH